MRPLSKIPAPLRWSLALLASLALPAFHSGHADAAVWTVGTSAHCDFTFLDDAIRNSGDGDTLQLEEGSYDESDDGAYTSGGFRIEDQSLTVIGGHSTCGGPRVGTSTLTADSWQRILTVISSQDRVVVQLEHLVVTGGHWTSPYTEPYAGGILAQGYVDLNLEDVRVVDNEGIFGGGVTLLEYSPTNLPRLSLTDSEISGNDAVEDGGGLYCRRGVVALRRSRIGSNSADARGGGAFLDGCHVYAHGAPVSLDWNTAGSDGGGAFLTDSSSLTFHPSSAPAGSFDVSRNTATGSGGGLYLEDSSALEAIYTHFVNNLAGGNGGGIAAYTGSDLSVGESLQLCGKLEGCQSFRDNIAWQSGGALHLGDVTAFVSAVRGHGNVSLLGAGAFASAGKGSWLQVWSTALDGHHGDTLISAASPDVLDLRSSTFFDNTLGDAVVHVKKALFASVSQSIFHGNDAPYVTGAADFTCNLVDDDDGFPLPAGAIQSLEADPLFAGPGDYHLSAWSPALSMCGDDTLHASSDLELDARPGPSFDAGADER